jgi:hypothetical protein
MIKPHHPMLSRGESALARLLICREDLVLAHMATPVAAGHLADARKARDEGISRIKPNHGKQRG